MFTGIIEEMGLVNELIRHASSATLSVKAEKVSLDTKQGDSISVNGACLTVIENNNGVLKFDVSSETLTKTNLANLKSGERVNLERALLANSRLGGHFVTGHVDFVSKIKKIQKIADNIKISFEIDYYAFKYIAPKGSVAIDGISLTIGEVLEDFFTVYLIPYTISNTTLGFKKEGDTINVELDILAKYTEKLLSPKEKKSNITPQFLAEHGFI